VLHAEDKTLAMKKNILFLLLIVIFTQPSCTKESKGFISTAGKGGSMARFTISGDHLYTVDKTKLKVYDISNAASPILTSTEEVGFEIETIYPFKDKLFIGSTSVVHIFSIEDPDHPKKLSTALSPQVIRRCDPVVAKDSVAYATLRTNNSCGGGIQSILAVYDIRDELNPVQIGQYPLFEPYGLGYIDSAVYVCDKTSLAVFNISLPYQPQRILQLNDGEYLDVIPDDNTLVCWVKEGIILYDISNRFDPKLIVKIQ
jgi:hypothetical protein